MKQTLSFEQTFKEAFQLGFKNALSIIACYLLWLVTIWIPYLNIGTTIAINMLPAEIAKGECINPLYIFKSSYRRRMGEYFLLESFMVFGLYAAAIFLLAPAIVLAFAWGLSLYIMLSSERGPMEALKASNDATYGSKWKLLWLTLVFCVMFGVLFGVATAACGEGTTLTYVLYGIIFLLIVTPIYCGMKASVWKQLRGNVE